MRRSITISPPNSLLFISDPNGGTAPQITRGRRMWATPSCIVVGCLAFMDGETAITLGAAGEVNPGGVPAFDGLLETPNRAVVVSTAEKEPVLEMKAHGSHTPVRVWTNHPTEPDRVIVGID
jgi:hypothetical protein